VEIKSNLKKIEFCYVDLTFTFQMPVSFSMDRHWATLH